MYSQTQGVANESGAVACGRPSRWCAMWLLYQLTTKPNEKMPPWKPKSRYMSAAPSHGIMAASDGGFRLATSHCVIAKYEMPLRPTRPLHHGCRAAHSITS